MSDILDSFDVGKMLRVMEMAKIMTENTNNQNEEHTNSDEQTSQNIKTQNNFDSEIQTEFLRSVKAAIPFLDIPYRKNLSVMIKLLEIQKLSAYYETQLKEIAVQSKAQSQQTGVFPTEMLRAVRNELSDENRQKIDTFINMMDLLVRYREIKEMMD